MSLTRIYPITLKLSTTPVVRPDENRKDVHNKPRAPRTTGPQSYNNNHFLFGCQQPNSTSKFYVWYFRTALQEDTDGLRYDHRFSTAVVSHSHHGGHSTHQSRRCVCMPELWCDLPTPTDDTPRNRRMDRRIHYAAARVFRYEI